jgi:hypothetical protein
MKGQNANSKANCIIVGVQNGVKVIIAVSATHIIACNKSGIALSQDSSQDDRLDASN